MKAAWYESIGPAQEVLRRGDRPTPAPGPGEVRVEVCASGVNPSDVKARAGSRGAVVYPYVIPHSDGAGVIDAVGDGVSRSRLGERVWIWNAAWKRAFGTCAEFVCLPADQAIGLPEATTFSQGACLGIPAMTAAHAVLGDGPVTGQTVLVTGGAGAVGHYAIQFAVMAGAQVIATVSGAPKAHHARAAGAHTVLNYREENLVEKILALTGGRGVDKIIEVEFGGNLAVTRQILNTGATIAAYGSAAERAPILPFYDLMSRHITLHMILVYLLSPQQRANAVQAITAAISDDKLVHAVSAEFSLHEVVDAHLLVESGKAIGNVIVKIP